MISLCYSGCLCKRERGMRLQEKAIEHFENQLDIRSIVKTRIDLSILLSLLLSKEQLLLFRNQHARAFASYDRSKKKKMRPEPRNEPADSLMDPDFLHLPSNGIKKAYEGIKGYRVQTEFDRKLLFGVWKYNQDL